jgi:PTS system cellobiose-specific IIC component
MNNQKIMDKVDKALPVILKFVNSKPIKAIKDGFIYTMPLTIIGSIFLLLAFIPVAGYNEFMAGIFGKDWMSPLFQITGATFDLLALFGVFGIAYSYVKNEGIDGVSAGIFAMVSLVVVNNAFVVASDGSQIGGVIPKAFLGGKGMIAAIIIGITVGFIYSHIVKNKWTIKMPESVPPGVANAFTSLIPGMVIIGLAFCVHLLFKVGFKSTFIEVIYKVLQTPLQGMSDSFGGAIAIALLISLFWWCGIHGATIIGGIMGPLLQSNGLANQELFNQGVQLVAGENAAIVTNQFVDQYITFGGSGLTLGLVCTMLYFAKSKQYKQLGRLSIVPGLFNINEPIIFGFPIVFNPIMAIPFILAPVLSAIMVYVSISTGLVEPFRAISVPWTTPFIISGFIIGGIRAAILQLAVFSMTVAVYFPFFKYQDKLAAQEESKEVATAN